MEWCASGVRIWVWGLKQPTCELGVYNCYFRFDAYELVCHKASLTLVVYLSMRLT
jgi:hypothetical protein